MTPWITGGLVLCFLLLTCGNLYLLKERKRKLEELGILQLQLQEQNRRMLEIDEQQREIANIRHDYKNHIMCGVALLNENKVQEAKEYFMKWMDYALSDIHSFVSTKSEAVNAVINAKLSLCDELGIHISASVCSEFGSISDMDLCIILFNLLDNAIDACKQVSNTAEIHLEIFQNKSYLVIRISNSIRESVLKNNPGFQTTKYRKHMHGIGLRTVRRIAAKYQDMFRIKEEDGKFVVELWLVNREGDFGKYAM